MHPDEVATDARLVRRLLADQFPCWADQPIRRLASTGTDNAIYRLGRDLAVRLPRIHWAAGQPDKEWRWLPTLAPGLPLAISAPLALGAPGHGYPWRWTVCPWLPGRSAAQGPPRDLDRAARDLAGFVAALQRCDARGGPPPSPASVGRGVPLAERDAYTRDAIARLARLGGEVDVDAVTAAWGSALREPAWDRPPVWIHGDLQAGNLLVRRGRLDAVIDFGCLGVGDPAADLMVAWTMFAGKSRQVFRATLAHDDATWRRGRGWALSVALVALPYYLGTNPTIVAASRHAIAEVLADVAADG